MLALPIGKILLSVRKWLPNFLLRDDFTTARAPILGRLAEPGPGILTLVQTDGQFSTSSGKLNFPAQSTPVYGDLGFYGAGLARLAGRALISLVRMTTVSGFFPAAWAISPTLNFTAFANQQGSVHTDGANLWAGGNALGSAVASAFSLNTDYYCAVILRGTGAFVFIKGGIYTSWTLLYVVDGGTTTPLYPAISGYTGVGTLDSFRVLDLAAPFATDYGLATDRKAGVVTDLATYVHTADCVIEFIQTTIPVSSPSYVAFRYVDANNFWLLSATSSGGINLIEKVAGSNTTRGTAAAVLSNGHRVVVVCEGTTIRVYSNNVLRITYSSASNFATATAGNMNLQSGGAVISDIVSWPRTLSGAAATLLDNAAAGTASTYLLNDEFTTDDPAPLDYSTRTAEPTGTLTITDGNNKLSIAAGKATFVTGGVGNGDPGWYGSSLARTIGRTVAAIFNQTSGNISIGWDSAAGGVLAEAFRGPSSVAVTTGITVTIDTLSNAIDYQCVVIMRSSGMLFAIKGGVFTQWTIVWISTESSADRFPAVSGLSTTAVGIVDSFRVLDLPAPYTTDYGIATQRLAGARAQGDTFTHQANCVIEWTLTTLPSTPTQVANVEFRSQDASNAWVAQVEQDGDFRLYELVAGGYTQRASSSAIVSSGHRIVIICDGTTIRGYSNNVLRWTYSSASNFATATNGRIEKIDTGGVVSDIISWPRTLTGAAANYLDQAVS